jgi:hypothetical protein
MAQFWGVRSGVQRSFALLRMTTSLLAGPRVLRGGFGTFAFREQADERLQVIVMFGSRQNQFDSHSESRVHGLHYPLNAQFQVLRADDDFDVRTVRERRRHFYVATA